MLTIATFVDGRFRPPASAVYLDDIDPATGQVCARVPDSDARDVESAVDAAQRAFSGWSQTPAEQRSRALMRLAELVERELGSLAQIECFDTGKPLSRCRSVDIPRAVQNLRFFAGAILHARSDLHVSEPDALNYTLRQPRGVCGLIVPWNLPLYLLTWKIAPALAAGNTAVAKPSEVTPLSAHRLAELSLEAGLPSGVLNIVHGLGAKCGAAIVGDPRVSTLSFTGGTKTGAAIASAAAPLFKKVSLEMGGKNPNIVFADCDLVAAVEGSVQAAFANQGQICLCGSRLLIERSVFDEFSRRFCRAAAGLRLGDPLDPQTQQGALVSAAQLDKVRYYVELARTEGGAIALGGTSPPPINERCRGGFFFQPTVITGLGPLCRTNQEEIFGPVVTLQPFGDEREAIELANATVYGLSASVWTSDVHRSHRVAERLEAGTVWVNCWLLRDLRVPFGGMKQSGVGREGGEEALRFFTEPKNVCLRVAR